MANVHGQAGQAGRGPVAGGREDKERSRPGNPPETHGPYRARVQPAAVERKRGARLGLVVMAACAAAVAATVGLGMPSHRPAAAGEATPRSVILPLTANHARLAPVSDRS